jgi:hypothetical protein
MAGKNPGTEPTPVAGTVALLQHGAGAAATFTIPAMGTLGGPCDGKPDGTPCGDGCECRGQEQHWDTDGLARLGINLG